MLTLISASASCNHFVRMPMKNNIRHEHKVLIGLISRGSVLSSGALEMTCRLFPTPTRSTQWSLFQYLTLFWPVKLFNLHQNTMYIIMSIKDLIEMAKTRDAWLRILSTHPYTDSLTFWFIACLTWNYWMPEYIWLRSGTHIKYTRGYSQSFLLLPVYMAVSKVKLNGAIMNHIIS
jgi:hypothetical protein